MNKLIRWANDGYPPIDLNENTKEVVKLIGERDALLISLKWAFEKIKVCEKQIPLKNSFNLAKPSGQAAWEIFSHNMILIEKLISQIS